MQKIEMTEMNFFKGTSEFSKMEFAGFEDDH
jgi:hypothetical protein